MCTKRVGTMSPLPKGIVAIYFITFRLCQLTPRRTSLEKFIEHYDKTKDYSHYSLPYLRLNKYIKIDRYSMKMYIIYP